MRLLQCQPCGGGMFYIIDIDRQTENFSKEEETQIWVEVKAWVGC
jgi:hypothetical protein